MLSGQRSGTTVFWSDQGDAAAGVEVEDEDLAAAAELER